MSKFDAIFNEIRFSEKYLRTSELGTCDAVFHKFFFVLEILVTSASCL